MVWDGRLDWSLLYRNIFHFKEVSPFNSQEGQERKKTQISFCKILENKCNAEKVSFEWSHQMT